MAPEYAINQPAGFKNRIQNVAVVGAGGNIGKHITEALVATGKHNVTALTRADSKNVLPSGAITKHVDYAQPSTLVSALSGIDFLIITMSVSAPKDTEHKLIDAAIAARVPYVMPNEYGGDPTLPEMAKDTFLVQEHLKSRARIQDSGVSSPIGLICSFWYEFSLAGSANRYGFDFPNKKVVFFDDGKTKINTSTWPLCAQAVAALLSLPILPHDKHDKSPTVSQFKNDWVYVSSFCVSQRDMLDSVLRVTGDKESDWTITHENSKERYEKGVEDMKKGDMSGFARLLYTRLFYPDGCGNYEARRGLHNEMLGLDKEDLDKHTKLAVDMALSGGVAY